MGPAVTRLEAAGLDTDGQNVVCFTEAPLQNVRSLLGDIEGRSCHFQPYGVALTKHQGRQFCINPVWYLDQTPGLQGQFKPWLNTEVDKLVEAAIAAGQDEAAPIFQLTPFIEQMGTWEGSRKEFWWEREWRCRGNFGLPDRVIVLCPENDFDEFKALIRQHGRQDRCALIDPQWSLERMIAYLAGFSRTDALPF